jgi:dihydroflavonol-4-reductase
MRSLTNKENHAQMDRRATLVTGGTGLLGAYLLKNLLDRGETVIALRRSSPPETLTPEEQGRIEWVEGGILDTELLDEVMSRVHRVYHCAGMVSFNPSRVQAMWKTNVEGTANIVNTALRHGVEKLVHVSSVSALGRKRNHQTVDENAKWDDDSNLSAYGRTKHLAEMEVWRGVAEGLNAVIVNPSIILGCGDWHKGSSAMFRNAYEEFKWYTDGTTGLVDARDVAEVMVRLMESPISSERFIVSAENWPYRKVFTRMAEAFGKKPPPLRASPWMGELVWRWEKVKGLLSGKDPLLTRETAETAQMHVSFDNGKIMTHLPGFRFRPLEQSIAEHCREYLVKIGRNG